MEQSTTHAQGTMICARWIKNQPPPGTTDLQPAFSPDERQLAFARDVGKGVSVVEILALGAPLDVTPHRRPA